MTDLLWIAVLAASAFMLGRTSSDYHCETCDCDDDGPDDEMPTCPDDPRSLRVVR